MEQLGIGFDYGALDPGSRDTVIGCRDEIRAIARTAVWEIGMRLNTVHGVLSGSRDGSFPRWVESETGISLQTAYNYMAVARHLPQLSNDLKIDGRALYALAAETTPQPIREEFIERAEAGESIRFRDVRDRLAADRPEPEHDPPPLLSIVDLETGEIVATEEEYREQLLYGDGREVGRSPSVASLPPSSIPTMREKTREEMAFDRLAAMTIITDLDPVAVADAAADFRADTARLLLRRMPALEAWADAFASHLRSRLDAPLRAVR